MTTKPTLYTGTLHRGEAPDTITGNIVDAWGWSIELTGARQADGSYTLTGTLGPVVEALRIPLLDDPQEPPTRRERVPAVPWVEVPEG